MNGLELYLFDDAVARDWRPFSLTRPIGELMLGAFTSRARAERWTGLRCAGHVSAQHLRGSADHDGVRVIDPDGIPTDRPRLFLSSRFVPAWEGVALEGGCVLRSDGQVVGIVVPTREPNPDTAWFTKPASLPGTASVDVAGHLVDQVWDLIAANPEQITRDFEAAAAGRIAGRRTGEAADRTNETDPRIDGIGYRPELLRIGAGVVIEPNVIIDFSHGPVWLDEGVTVRAFTRLAGPSYVGRGSTLLGGPFDTVSIGPVCKVHGELEETIVLGYSNKAHDGFLGHAYLGRWVNLGAMTTNSDLKNNYGTIRMTTPGGEVDTGLIKLGCLLGDHVKTGIGALLNTGTVVGAGSNLFGTEMPPKHVPPFSWGSGAELVAYDVERFIGVARTVMGRRDLEMDAPTESMLRNAWRIGREGIAS